MQKIELRSGCITRKIKKTIKIFYIKNGKKLNNAIKRD